MRCFFASLKVCNGMRDFIDFGCLIVNLLGTFPCLWLGFLVVDYLTQDFRMNAEEF